MSEQADECYVQFSTTHPGVWAASTALMWERAVEAGWSPTTLVSAAEVYRRLMDAQDGDPTPQKEWLADILGEKREYERNDDYYDCIVAGIRAMRSGRRIGQEELATKAGLHQAALSRIETGATARPRHEHLEQIAVALDATLDDLVVLGGEVLA